MKVHHVKLGFLALLFICLYSNVNVGHSEVVWSDDFNDEKLDGWTVVMGQLSAEGGLLHSIESGWIIDQEYTLQSGAYHPSTVSIGTWSFDFLLNSSDTPEIALEFLNLEQNKWSLDEMGGKQFKSYGFYAGWSYPGQYKILKNPRFPNSIELALVRAPHDIENVWHHVDITRDENGRIVVWVDGELIADLVDTEHEESKYFGVHLEYSHRGYSYIDNIVVSNTIDIEPPQKTQSNQIPGFSIESITLGLVSGAILLWILRRNQLSNLSL